MYVYANSKYICTIHIFVILVYTNFQYICTQALWCICVRFAFIDRHHLEFMLKS